jgi:hypothetical protein
LPDVRAVVRDALGQRRLHLAALDELKDACEQRALRLEAGLVVRVGEDKEDI